MSKRLIIFSIVFVFALGALIAVGWNRLSPSHLLAPHVYLSGQKAHVRIDNGQAPQSTVQSVETTVCFWTPSMKSAVLAARSIKSYTGEGFISGPGFVSLEPDGFHDELKFDKATDYGILAVPLSTDIVKETPGGKYPVIAPKPGPAVIYISDSLGSEAKKYNIEIKNVSDDTFTFTAPQERKLTFIDGGSPIIQDNAFVGAAHDGVKDTDTIYQGLSASAMYQKLTGESK